MIDFFYSYRSVLDQILILSLLAMSQAIVLRAGTFSVGSAAFAAIGAYTSAILVTSTGWHPLAAIALGTLVAGVFAAIMAFPLARLRGVYQAVATIALVQVVVTVAMNWDGVTNGAIGITGIPKVATTPWLIAVVLAVLIVLHAIGSLSLGRAMDVIREDETVAVSLGISVAFHQRFAMTLSGLLAGLAGGLHAFNSYAINPEEFGFSMLANILAMSVLGGQTSVIGPVIGAAILTLLPEIFRVFEHYREIIEGVLLMLIIIYLPHGIADTLMIWAHDRRLKRAASRQQRKLAAVTP